MARRLIWSPRALKDADEIAAYIANDSAFHAKAVARRLFARADTLTDQPGRRVLEFDGKRELREVFVHRWRLIYEVKPETVTIIAIIHGARLLENTNPLAKTP